MKVAKGLGSKANAYQKETEISTDLLIIQAAEIQQTALLMKIGRACKAKDWRIRIQPIMDIDSRLYFNRLKPHLQTMMLMSMKTSDIYTLLF